MEIVHLTKADDVARKIDTLFQEEKSKLLELIPAAAVEHVGGTAVPGLLTKGDLDINVRVQEKVFSDAVERLKGAYEINQPHNWTPAYASFKDDSRDLGIQLTAVGSPVDYFVAQRDILRAHPGKVVELNRLKEKFEGKDMDSYRLAKGEFFEKLST
ncbi:MAG: GrpB family protein [Minisyncoccia bacterium]